MSTEEFFGKYASDYAKSESHAKGSDLETMVELADPSASSVVLDLATGTGFTAVAFAKKAKSVTAIDMTDEMLSEAKSFAEKEGADNIIFVKGDVEKLPFGDGTFDIVTCRRAAHHFYDKAKFISEAHRVLKTDGVLSISDMVSPEGDLERSYDRMERYRDHSHVGAEPISGWNRLLEQGGFKVVAVKSYEDRMTFEKWIYPVPGESQDGKASWKFLENSSLEFKRMIGFREEEQSFIKRRAVFLAGRIGIN